MYLHLTIPPTLIIYEVTNVRACYIKQESSCRLKTTYPRRFAPGLSTTQKREQEHSLV